MSTQESPNLSDSPHIPQLPLDVADIVLSYLHDDKQSLSRCSLVSKTWLPFSRRHLFRSASLDAKHLPTKPYAKIPEIPVVDFDAFIAFVCETPRIAASIHRLEIRGVNLPHNKNDIVGIDDFLDCLDDGESFDRKYGDITWSTLGLDQLADILRHAPRLKTLVLRDIVLKVSPVSADNPIVLDTLEMDAVGALRDENIFHLFDFLRPKHLNFDVFRCQYPLFGPSQYCPAYLALTSVKVSEESDARVLLEVLQSLVGMQKIQSFKVQVSSSHVMDRLATLLPMLFATLQRLGIDLRGVFRQAKPEVLLDERVKEIIANNFNLSPLVNLRCFGLVVKIGMKHEARETIREVCTILSRIPETVKSININFYFVYLFPHEVVMVPWGELNLALERFSEPQKVTLTISDASARNISKDVQESLQEHLRAKLPHVQSVLDLRYWPAY